MTDDEIRIAIAKLKGWTVETKTITSPTRDGQEFTYTASFWTLPDGLRRQPPEWPEVISAAWELVEEMALAGFGVTLSTRDGLYSCYIFGPDHQAQLLNSVVANTPARAICEAYLAWKAGV